MTNPYVPLLFLMGIALVLTIGGVAASALIGPKRYNRAKLDAYECGIEPTPQPIGGGRFPVKYYLTAMLFIVFDIEIIFLYPYAVVYRDLGGFGLVELVAFSVPVFASFVFLIANGALDWGPSKVLESRRNAERTTTSTIRRVGLEGRDPSQEVAA